MNTVHDGEREPGRMQDANHVAQRTLGWRRLTINITPVERLGRVAIGLFAMIAGVLLLTAAGSALAVVLELLLILAGADLAVTGALGHCPLYRKLGYIPSSLRKAS